MRTVGSRSRIEAFVEPKPHRRAFVRLGGLAAILAAALAVALSQSPSVGAVHGEVARAGRLGPLVFIAIYVVLTVALVPGTASTIASGILFGPALGTGYAIIGATLGAVIAFVVGRRLGRDGVRDLLGPRAPRVEAALDNTTFTTMLVLRLLPIVPFNGLNYAAGATGIGLRDYVAATALGIVPGTTAVAFAGSSVTHPTSPTFLISAAAGVLILGASLVLHQHRRAIGNAHPPDESGSEE